MNIVELNIIDEVTNNCIVTNMKTVAYCYNITLAHAYSLSENEVKAVQYSYMRLINALPINCTVKFYAINTEKSKTIQSYLNSNILQKFYINHFSNRKTKLLKVCMSLVFDYGDIENITEVEKKLKEISEQISLFENATVPTFESMKGGKITPMKESEVWDFVQDYYFDGLEKDISERKLGKETFLTVRDDLVCAYSVSENKEFDNAIMDIDNIGKLPIGFGDKFALFLGMPGISVLTVFIENPNERKAKIIANKQTYHRLSYGAISFEKKIKKLEALLEEFADEHNEKRIVQMNYTLFVPFKDEVDLSNINKIVAPIFVKGGLKIKKHVSHIIADNLYIYLNPYTPITPITGLFTACYSNVATVFLPTQEHYKEDAEGIYFCDRFNNPIKVDLWDSSNKYMNARNFMILAPTGSGKSFLAQEWLRQYFEQGLKIVIIDIGKSFKKFAQILGDKALYIEYQHGKNFGVNPFAVEKSKLLSIEYLDYLSKFVWAHVTKKDIATETESVFIKETLKEYINSKEEGHNPYNYFTFFLDSDYLFKQKFSELIKAVNYSQMRNLLPQFIKGGDLHFLYDESKKEKLSVDNKDVVVFEIESALTNDKIMNVLLLSINYTIENNILKDVSKKGIVFFDEFAKTLLMGNVLEQVQFLYQSIRKKNGSIGVVLQSVEQLPLNSTAQAIIDNTQIFMILKDQKGYNRLTEKISMNNANTLTVLESINSNLSKSSPPPYYTEVFIKRGNEEAVYRIEVSKEQQLAFATSGAENIKIINEHEKTQKPIIEIIEELYIN
ncbi:MAG: DUF87 domain-containing protein [Phycisphaerales bacterium]|nr:DUF87 domain-containing protein [Phycisphaerales bacterium]